MKNDKSIKIGLALLISVIYLVAASVEQYYVLDWFTTDDAFYYFKIADNIAKGMGSTFDGLSKVNGYHPLWMIILIPIFLTSKISLILPLRIIILVQLGLSLSGFFILYGFLKKHLSIYSTIIISVLWVLLPKIFAVATNGTESALNGFLLTVFFVKFTDISLKISNSDGNVEKQVFQLGLLTTLLLTARLDNAFTIAVFGFWLGLQYLISVNWDLANFWKMVRMVFFFAAPSVLSLGLYLIFNQVTVGSAMPISGQIKKYWGGLQLTSYGSRVKGKGNFIAEFLSPDRNIGPWNLILEPYHELLESLRVTHLFGTREIYLGSFVLVLIAFFLGLILTENKDFVITKLKKWPFIPLFIGCLLHISYYKLSGSLAQRSWYWVSETFFLIILFGLVTESLIIISKRGNKSISSLLGTGLVAVMLLMVLKPHAIMSINRVSNNHRELHYYEDRTSWLAERTPKGSRIGMTGAGNAAYFIQDRMIVNLDGLVNGIDYFEALRNAEVGDYLMDIELDYIFGNEGIFLETDPYRENYSDLLENSRRIDAYDNMSLWELNLAESD